MKLSALITYLEQIAPPIYQASYDNAGLIVGDREREITGVLTCLDSTEAVLDEAIANNCNVIVAHHPIVFKGLKSITGKNYVERVILKAIKNDIAIYATHTNLDSMYHNGVNAKIAQRLELVNTRILAPQKGMKKIALAVPTAFSDEARKLLVGAGAGEVNHQKNNTYASLGVGTQGETSSGAMQLQLLFPIDKEYAVLKALEQLKPKTAFSYDITTTDNAIASVGAGMIGELKNPMSANNFLSNLKDRMVLSTIRHTRLLDKPIKRVAVCGGAGSFLLPTALRQQADIFITADFKYHEFFDADGRIIIADIGHYESEQFTILLLSELISDKFTNFAVLSTTVRTNPVYYF